MKFVQKSLAQAADASGSERGQLREMVKVAFWIFVILLVIYLGVGIVVDIVVSRISVETEKNLFSVIPLGRMNADRNDRRLQPIEKILARLASQPGVPKLDFRLVLLPNPKPNAFAFPGGTIGITRGLLERLQNQELAIAFVLGHELGHFHNRDHLRGLGRAIGISVCYALVFGRSSTADVVARNSLRLMQRKYSRNQERAADRFGLRLIYRVYGRTDGVDRLFRILRNQQKIPGWAYMLATHPDPGERIENLRKYAREFEAEQRKQGVF